MELEFDVTLTGFSLAEVDLVLDGAADADPDSKAGPEDEIPPPAASAVSQPGDLWRLGRHKVLCGDARKPADYTRLLGDERCALVFTDPPYNVPIDGHVCGSGRVRHREFAMAAGEMSASAFTGFLGDSLGAMAACCRDGAIAFPTTPFRRTSCATNSATRTAGPPIGPSSTAC